MGYDKDGKKIQPEQDELELRSAPVDKTGAFFIPGNVASKKNSKRIVPYTDKDGKKKQRVISSKQWLKYEKDTEGLYKILASRFRKALADKSKPYDIKFTFARTTRRSFDYNNLARRPHHPLSWHTNAKSMLLYHPCSSGDYNRINKNPVITNYVEFSLYSDPIG